MKSIPTGENSHSPSPLDTISFPLNGHRLIEASAGTGKTYTIANLYLRLLTGHGTEKSRFIRPLHPAEILVVTFTEAATQELRERVRARIHLALQVFSEQTEPEARQKILESDAVLTQLYEDLPEHSQVARQLLYAERQMDEAAIFTIHGFCYRMLSQFAFESRSLFNRTLTTDENALLGQACCDFWRKSFYTASEEVSLEIYQYWKNPEQLLASIRSWIHRTDLEVLTRSPDDCHTRKKKRQIATCKIKQQWMECHHLLNPLITRSDINLRSYNRKHLSRWFEQITLWCESSSYCPPECLEKFSARTLADKTPEGGKVPEHPLFDAIEKYLAIPATCKDIFLSGALSGIKSRLYELKKAKRTLGFDDLLAQFDQAISFKGGERLKKAVRSAFPIAVIDEFQDTDALQYRIFHALYPDDKKQYGLLMIGDPKQAIYAFRGADIFSYINARRNTASRYTLPVNWRSTPEMIKACNTLFSRSPAPFIHEKDIPFSPVQAASKAKGHFMKLKGKPAHAMTLWCQPAHGQQPVNVAEYAKCMTRATVEQIHQLLALSRRQQGVICKDGNERPLAANDIAILVRTGTEAQWIRKGLADSGISSVYMSERDSVFDTREAMEIHHVLNACLAPENESLLRTALGTALVGLEVQELDQLREDEQAWEKIVEEFCRYHQFWMKQGVLSFLRQLLFGRGITHRLLNSPAGERRLTDITHLGELLSSAEQKLDSPQALLHWLWVHIQNHADDPAYQLHLESDRELVRVITIHKSKGLEYPVVFIPYACCWKSVKKESSPEKSTGYFFHDEETTRPVLDLACGHESYLLAEKERLAEDVRLLYVAVTRAIYQCYIGLGPVRKHKIGKKETETHLHHTAVGYLLNHHQPVRASELFSLVQTHWSEKKEVIAVTLPPEPSTGNTCSTIHETRQYRARDFSGQIQRNWHVTSYSALGGAHTASASPAETTRPEAIKETGSVLQGETKNVFTFPKGARSGVFLHGLFEQMVFTTARKTPPSEMIEKSLLDNGFDPDWQPVIETLTKQVLNASLIDGITGTTFSLGDIDEADKYVEMEFYLPVSFLQAPAINQLIRRHDPVSQKAENLSFESLKGMLKGFIDLVFLYNGRYYIVDYKSNHLGDSHECYHGEALLQSMVDHRYDFQYQLYTLALHRLLQQRVRQYDYDSHMGGVFYLFIRGMRHEQSESTSGNLSHSQGSGIFHSRPSKAMIEEMDHLFAGK